LARDTTVLERLGRRNWFASCEMIVPPDELFSVAGFRPPCRYFTRLPAPSPMVDRNRVGPDFLEIGKTQPADARLGAKARSEFPPNPEGWITTTPCGAPCCRELPTTTTRGSESGMAPGDEVHFRSPRIVIPAASGPPCRLGAVNPHHQPGNGATPTDPSAVPL